MKADHLLRKKWSAREAYLGAIIRLSKLGICSTLVALVPLPFGRVPFVVRGRSNTHVSERLLSTVD